MTGLNNKYFRIVLSALIILIAGHLRGQETANDQSIYPTGVTLKYGYGFYSLRDNYISGEKYSGGLPYLSFGWARSHAKYVYRFDMDFRNSDNICNHNVSTDIYQFKLNQGFLYPLERVNLFRKDLCFWIGPA